MTPTLVDTSVWVRYLRNVPGRAADELEKAFSRPSEIRICAPIRMELEMADDVPSRRRARRSYLGFESILSEDADFDEAARIFNDARRSGYTIRSRIDLLIAAIAGRAGVRLVHCDSDFDRIAEVRPEYQIESWL